MPIKKPPLSVFCFKCEKEILIKFIPLTKKYSEKNDWFRWTKKEENKGKHICDKCLKNLAKKNKRDFLEQIKNLKARARIRKYIREKVIN